MRQREVLQNLPKITQALGTITNINPDANRNATIALYDQSVKDTKKKAYTEYGDTSTKPTRVYSDIEQLGRYRSYYTIDLCEDFDRAKKELLEISLGAMARLSEKTYEKRDEEEEKIIVKETKYIAKNVVFDALQKEDNLTDEQKKAVKQLGPILPLGQRVHTKFLK